jgi:hypothetical protein
MLVVASKNPKNAENTITATTLFTNSFILFFVYQIEL